MLPPKTDKEELEGLLKANVGYVFQLVGPEHGIWIAKVRGDEASIRRGCNKLALVVERVQEIVEATENLEPICKLTFRIKE